mgnify:CR=1 FL=1
MQTFALKCITMHSLPSAAVKTGLCKKIWSTDHIECRPTKYFWPRAIQMVDDQFPLAGGVSSWLVTFHSDQEMILEHH